MKNMDIKSKILQEIMDLMDEKEGDSLKSHPKLMAAKIDVLKPEDGKLEEGSPEEEKLESPEMEMKEKSDDDEIDPDLLEELMRKLKG